MEFIDPFPLLRLPVNARTNVLRNMEILRLLSLSLCSKSTKNLIRSLNLKADEVVVQLGQLCVLSIMFKGQFVQFAFATTEEDPRRRIRPRIGQDIPVERIFALYNTVADDYYWHAPEFTARDWFEHFCSVFHRPKIENIEVRRPTIHIDSLMEAVQGLEVFGLIFYPSSPDWYSQQMLQNFPLVAKLFFKRNFFETVTKTHQCFVQNLHQLFFLDGMPITLNDLLVTNSSHVFIKGANWTEKLLNRFLKLWRLGSCPNLEHFSIDLTNNRVGLNKDIVLKGLKSMETEEIVRFFDRWDMRDEKGERPHKQKVQKGYDIWRYNGTCATVVLERWNLYSSLKFFVWS